MKVEYPDIRNTNYVLNETIGSSMGEIVFPAPTVKIETMDFDDQDIANTILTEHSPQCQLHLRISNIISIRSNSHNSTNESQSQTNQTIGKIITEQSSSGAPSSQEVTRTSEDVIGILSPSSRTSEKSMDATPSFTNIDNIPKVKSTSQEVSWDNLAVPIVFNDSQEVTIPYTNSDYTVGNSLQDITIGSQDITNVSQDITNVLNLATASSNSDTNMPMIDNTLDTEAKSTSQVVTASPLKDITIPTSNVMSLTSSDTINITPLDSQDNIAGSLDISSVIQLDASNAADSDDTIIIIQLDYSDPTTAPAYISSESAETSATLNETTSTTQGSLNKRTQKFLASVGISEALYRANVNMYYTIYSLEEDDVDYISFMSILESSCSVSAPNLSAENIEFEKTALKASSPSQTARQHLKLLVVMLQMLLKVPAI